MANPKSIWDHQTALGDSGPGLKVRRGFRNKIRFDGYTVRADGELVAMFGFEMTDAATLAKCSFLDACTTRETGTVELRRAGKLIASMNLDAMDGKGVDFAY